MLAVSSTAALLEQAKVAERARTAGTRGRGERARLDRTATSQFDPKEKRRTSSRGDTIQPGSHGGTV